MTMTRRHALTAGAAALLLAALAGCGGENPTGRDDTQGGAYRGGKLSVATGNTAGVYYVMGGGYANLVSKHVPGYQATAEATGASIENIQRVVRGDNDIAFTLADAAADAAQGKGAFSAPQPIRALARIYTNYTHVIVRKAAGISDVAGMKGKRISTGSPNSGTENIAFRLLKAAGLDPAKDIKKESLSLQETVQGMKDGTLDGLFWSGGRPTSGITDLTTSKGTEVTFLPLGDLLSKLQAEHGQIYQADTLSKDVYKTPADVPTIAVPNLLVVSDKMPDDLARSLTEVLFKYQADLAQVHPEAKNIKRDTATQTEPVKLHPGAEKYFAGG